MSELSDLQGLTQAKKEGRRRGVVAKANNGKLTITLANGTTRTVYGSADVNDNVIVQGDQLVGVISSMRKVRMTV